MSTAVSTVEQSFTPAEVETLRVSICKDLNESELSLFIQICKMNGLSPFTRQIYATKTGRGNDAKLTPVVSIDGLRLIAARSGKYTGQTPTEWCGQDGQWVDVWLSDDTPAAARVGVLHADFAAPLYATLTWREYTGGQPSFMQKRMPAHMIGKAAESLALRKAFPNETSGLYTPEELENDAGSTIDDRQVGIITAIIRQTNPAAAEAVATRMRNTRVEAWPQTLTSAVSALCDALSVDDGDARQSIHDALAADDATADTVQLVIEANPIIESEDSE